MKLPKSQRNDLAICRPAGKAKGTVAPEISKFRLGSGTDARVLTIPRAEVLANYRKTPRGEVSCGSESGTSIARERTRHCFALLRNFRERGKEAENATQETKASLHCEIKSSAKILEKIRGEPATFKRLSLSRL